MRVRDERMSTVKLNRERSKDTIVDVQKRDEADVNWVNIAGLQVWGITVS